MTNKKKVEKRGKIIRLEDRKKRKMSIEFI